MTPQDVVKTLIMVGWKQIEISRAIGLAQPNISRIAAGSQECGWRTMDALRELLNQVPPRARKKI
jgi:predicted transcriptional regulator